MIKALHMYDLDGLAINSLHRYKTKNGKIDLEFWRENATRKNILADSLMPMAKHISESIANPEIFVVIATARACTKNDANHEFIYSKIGRPDRFFYRQGENDTRGGAELKIAGIRPLLSLEKFKDAKIKIYEDNVDYLRDICYALRKHHNVVGYFNPSYQGH